MKKIARAEKNKNNGLLPISASLLQQRILVLCRDRDFGIPVVTESLGREGVVRTTVRACTSKVSWRAGQGPARATRWPCARD